LVTRITGVATPEVPADLDHFASNDKNQRLNFLSVVSPPEQSKLRPAHYDFIGSRLILS